MPLLKGHILAQSFKAAKGKVSDILIVVLGFL